MGNKEKITALLQDTLLPSVHIDVVQEDTSCLESKFGGIFYLPQGEQIPVCPEGEQMQFLAQINFAELPPLSGFPHQGIVQFFLDTNEDRFYEKIDGEESKRELYTIRYYPNPNVVYQQNPTLENADIDEHLSIDWKNGKMQFEAVSEVATFYVGQDLVADMGYQHVWEKLTPALVKKAGYDIENWEDDTDDFCWDFGNWGCKIGGHPAFKSFDERIDNETDQPYETLLFQYDFATREEFEEDTFSFFIRPEDLANCRFDDVLLIWQNCF